MSKCYYYYDHRVVGGRKFGWTNFENDPILKMGFPVFVYPRYEPLTQDCLMPEVKGIDSVHYGKPLWSVPVRELLDWAGYFDRHDGRLFGFRHYMYHAGREEVMRWHTWRHLLMEYIIGIIDKKDEQRKRRK